MPLFQRSTPLCILACCLPLLVFAQEDKPKSPATLEQKIEPVENEANHKEKITEAHHTAKIAGKTIAYTTTVGTMEMKADDGKTKAEIFFIAYNQSDSDEQNKRPITFCFNGGPGSSSVWLHMGMLGPKRVKFPEEAVPIPPPGVLVENDYSLLDVTDLVFIDPVSTGFSRPAQGENKQQFHGYDEDLQSIGQFIYLYTSKYNRWLSPKYLLGESYGTLRAAGLSGYLQDRYYMDVNGIALISSVLNFQTLSFDTTNDLPYILYFPSYTATAYYHKRLSRELQSQELEEVLVQAEQFAMNDYAQALLKGKLLASSERKSIIQQYARYTGLSSDFIEQSNLRVSMSRFSKELLRDDRRTVGRYDSRYIGIDRDAAGDRSEYDASAAALFGPFTAALNYYLRTELKVESEKVYEILTSNVQPWSFKRFENSYVDASDTLRKAMSRNPFLKVFVASGYYDLATPYYASDHTFNQLALDPSLRKNIHIHYYPAGHMMYVHEPSLKKLRRDLERFYESSLNQKRQ